MIFNVHWRSGFGYGDFITGLGYSHVASLKYLMPVDISFHWDHDIFYKTSSEDPETIIDRFNFIYSTMKQSSLVKVKAETCSKFSARFINELDEFNPVHGLWYSNLPLSYTRTVVLWRSKFNTYFPGIDKDPIFDKWDYLIDYLEKKNFTIKEVTYRTPIIEVMNLISSCAFGVGYDGMVHQIFKYMWKPLLVFCNRSSLNNLLIPQAAQEKSYERFIQKGIDHYLDKSFQNIEKYRKLLDIYIHEKQDPTKHRLFNTAQY